MDTVSIFDTTLRDGEQSPGITLHPSEKLEIALQLARLGVDVIEAGFPITSPGDFEAVQTIARRVTGPTICALARTSAQDITTAWQAIKDSERPRIHTFIATSPLHMEKKLQLTPDDVCGQVRAGVAHAKELTDDVEFSAEDATRSDHDFLAEVISIALEEGAMVINLPDTVGYATPRNYYDLFVAMRDAIPGLKDAVLSTHCHDDLGLAVANSLAGVEGGARQVECTLNGIGERAGNAALEEIVMLLRTRGDQYGCKTRIATPELTRSARAASRLTGYLIPPNKAIVGKNAFMHESGIHQDGVLKAKRTYEIMDAESVGASSNNLVLGKHSGRHALKEALGSLGIHVSGGQLNAAFLRFKAVADRKGHITAHDLEALVADELAPMVGEYELLDFQVQATKSGAPQAAVTLRRQDGTTVEASSGGDGVIDALFKALGSATESCATLESFQIQSITEGTEALGEVSVVVVQDKVTAQGHGVSTDIIEAGAIAYLRAISRL